MYILIYCLFCIVYLLKCRSPYVTYFQKQGRIDVERFSSKEDADVCQVVEKSYL